MTLEQCFQKLDKYFHSSSTSPRFVNIQNIEDMNTFLSYYHVGNNSFFTVSKYCKPDEAMQIAVLQNDLSSQYGNIFVTELTSYLKLQGKNILESQLQNIASQSFMAHVVVVCYQCKEYLHFIDNARMSQFIYYVDGQPSDIANLVLISPDMPLPAHAKVIQGVHNIASELEKTDGGDIYVITKKQKSNYPNAILSIKEQNNAFSMLCNIDANTNRLDSQFGTQQQWNAALKNVMKYGCWEKWIMQEFGSALDMNGWQYFSDNKKWLYFIALKLNGNNHNWCIHYAISISENEKMFLRNIYRSILSLNHTDKDYWEKYDIWKALLLNINSDEESLDFVKMVQEKQQYALYYLTDNSKYEKEMILQLLHQFSDVYSRQEIEKILYHIYPDIAAYISPYRFENELLTNYFSDYCYQKVINRIYPEFLETVEKQSKQREFNRILSPRAKKVEKLNKQNCKLYFVDAMGAEYLGFILSKCREKEININVSVCRCELPSITSLNKEFLNSFLPEQIAPPIKRLDNIKHHGEESFDYRNTKFPFHLIRELEIINEVISNIKIALDREEIERAYIISDHGSSRLAVIRESECRVKMSLNGQYSGRCCPISETDEAIDFATEENGFWVLANYDRFKGSRAANVEVHGGASLEEVVVPIIELTNKQQNIEIKIHSKLPILLGLHKKAQIQLFSKTLLEKVSVCVKGEDVRGFHEKYYNAQYCENGIYTIDMPDVKKAGNYLIDVYSNHNLMASALKFTVKKEIAAEKELF